MELYPNGTIVKVDTKHYPPAGSGNFEVFAREVFHNDYSLEPTVFYYLRDCHSRAFFGEQRQFIVNAKYVKKVRM